MNFIRLSHDGATIKRLSILDFIPITSIGIAESKFPRLGYPGDLCGPMREPT